MPITSTITTSTIHLLPILLRPPNDLSSTKQASFIALYDKALMSHLLQSFHDLLIYALFNVHLTLSRLINPTLPTRLHTDTRRIQRFLRIQSEHYHIEQDLHVSLRLHESTHNAKAGMQTLISRSRNHARDDGIIWPLPRRIQIRMRLPLLPNLLRPKIEIRTAILQCEATALWDDSCAEAGVVAVYEAAGVAGGVGDGEVDCV